MAVEQLLGIAYHLRDLPPRDFLALVEDTLRKTGSFDGASLRPSSEEDDKLLHNPDMKVFAERGNTINLTHESLARLDEELGWNLSISWFSPEPGNVEVQFGPSPSGPGTQLVEASWQALTRVLAGYAERAQPVLAAINGLGKDEDADDIPTLDDLPPAGLPKFVVPWTYIAQDRLTPDLRTTLQDLPTFRSTALGKGWLIQSVERYHDKPAAAVVQKIKSLGGRGTTYHHTR